MSKASSCPLYGSRRCQRPELLFGENEHDVKIKSQVALTKSWVRGKEVSQTLQLVTAALGRSWKVVRVNVLRHVSVSIVGTKLDLEGKQQRKHNSYSVREKTKRKV